MKNPWFVFACILLALKALFFGLSLQMALF